MVPRKQAAEGSTTKKRAPRRSKAKVSAEKTNTSSSAEVHSAPAAAAFEKSSGTAPAPSETRAAERQHRVAERAYALFLQRGKEHGHALEDWLRAEREVAEEERRQP